MIDSQAQVRWLAVAAALIILVIGPVTAGMVFSDVENLTTKFTIGDLRWSGKTTISSEIAAAEPNAIFLVPPGKKGECGPETKAACPPLGADPVVVPMSTRVEDPAGPLEKAFPGLVVTSDTAAELPRTEENFSMRSALVTGSLLLIGTLLAVATLAGRQPRRSTPMVRDPAPSPYRPPAPVLRDAAPIRPPPPPPPATPPVLALADRAGIREVIREHGATAKARSHIDGAGGYVVLGDVLMWATPVGGGVAFPDDDVHVTVSGSVTPTLDGGLRP
jgi:hypothetical protein